MTRCWCHARRAVIHDSRWAFHGPVGGWMALDFSDGLLLHMRH
ncbi:MAG TPA: hypothetical protein VK156_05100 [Candidatus Limnocylindria bacterium]|nr:hypothetical protein [Candidatus Limnocylindria bacterium]